MVHIHISLPGFPNPTLDSSRSINFLTPAQGPPMKRDHCAPHSNKPSIRELPRNTTDLNGSKRRWPCKVAKSGSAAPAVKEMGDNEDLIEDDYDSYDELFAQHFTGEKLSQLDGAEVVPASQDNKPSISSQTKSARSLQKSTNNAKRFILQSKTPRCPDLQNEQKLPWAQRYAPQTLDELAVHKKKVSDVEQWLTNALTGKSRKNLLVLKGPTGSGKTTTISLLSDKLKFNILEWENPSGSKYGGEDYLSFGSQFDGFLSRSHKFRSLELDSSGGAQSPMKANPLQRRIILIEEFPTLSSPNASVLAAFRLSILRYISVNAPHVRTDYYSGETEIPPIVMIVSESFSNPESSFENLTVHRLLGREISNHSSTSVIEFNSIAPTFMSKALKLVLKKSAYQPMGNQASTQFTIKTISMIGDIRNAIASLEFFCLRSGNQWPEGFHDTTKIRAAARSRKKMPPVSSETQILSQREVGLGLFHAVGKIIYNKRNSSTDTENPQDLDQSGVSQVHVNELLNETGTDIKSFIGALHENYVPSCSGPSFTRCLDDCIGSLSDSDMLCVDQKGLSKPQAGLGTNFIKPGIGVDILRQDEISYQVAARGLLFSLPYPVKRQISHTGSTSHSNDSHKLFFPPAIRLARQFEETRNLIDSLGNALLGSTVRLSAVPLPGHARSISRNFTHEEGVGFQSNNHETSTSAAVPIAFNDLILHQLPYMTMILGKDVGSSAQRITSPETRGLNYRLQQDEQYAWGSSASGFRRLGRETRSPQLEQQALVVSQADDEQLFLSDDDIVDDL